MKSITLLAYSIGISFILMAINNSNWEIFPSKKVSCQTTNKITPPIFSYSLSPGNKNTITKERMHNAKTVSDLFPDYGMQERVINNELSLKDVIIRTEEENIYKYNHIPEKRNGNELSEGQLNILKSAGYSTSLSIEGVATSGSDNGQYFNYYLTVVPENQASHKVGNKAFVDYLIKNCQSTIATVQKGSLKSGKISFTVTKSGTITNTDINSTCGYPIVDERMVELISTFPDTWNVATNGNGEKVDQTFVFSFGQLGC